MSSDSHIPISESRLNDLIASLAELSVHQSILWNTRDTAAEATGTFLNVLTQAKKLTKEIYDQATDLRKTSLKIALETTWNNNDPLLEELNKSLKLTHDYEDLRIDKGVVPPLRDAYKITLELILNHHLVMETAEQRNVKIKAVEDARSLHIFIDYGLNPESNSFEMEKLDEAQRALKKVGGSLQITSSSDKSPGYLIRFPLSSNIIESIILGIYDKSSKEERYALPLDVIEEILTLDVPLPPSTEVIVHREEILAVLPLESLLTPKSHKQSIQSSGGCSVIICRTGKKKFGIIVDKVYGRQPVVLRHFAPNIEGVYGLKGAAILEDGTPGLILDAENLATTFTKKT